MQWLVVAVAAILGIVLATVAVTGSQSSLWASLTGAAKTPAATGSNASTGQSGTPGAPSGSSAVLRQVGNPGAGTPAVTYG